jgi:hypothetical protein
MNVSVHNLLMGVWPHKKIFLNQHIMNAANPSTYHDGENDTVKNNTKLNIKYFTHTSHGNQD